MTNPNVILAFIGESGTGKSTCINYFANYFAGTSYTKETGFSNIFVVIPNQLFPNAVNGYISSERNIRDNTKSQTTKCIEYDFVYKGHTNTHIKIVDTPGFNDTDNSRDDENIQKIIQAFAKLPFISAIIITLNGTITRLSSSIKTTLSQLRGSLPDSLFSNLFFVFTNCDETARSFDLNLIAEYKPEPQRIFHMQNSLFSGKTMDLINTDSKKRRMEINWQDSVDTITDLMAEVSRTAVTSTTVFNDMRIKREQLLSNKANLIVKQKSLLSIMHQLKIESSRLQNAQTDQAANQNYKQPKMIEKVEIEKKSYYSTVCNDSRHETLQVCHENCGLGYQPTLNFEHFKRCAASDGQNCRHCRCSMTQHYHTYEIPVKRQTTTEEIIQSKKAAFDQATRKISTSQNQLQNLNQTRTVLQAEANGCKQGILDSIRQLKKICSHYNFAEEMAATI
jgi:GTPase SAR1 family protein